MFRVFNCGIGMVLIVAEEFTDNALMLLQSSGESTWRIGRVERRVANSPRAVIE
jgi:phosphoribosylformylglycinamidine cyclo-ligase